MPTKRMFDLVIIGVVLGNIAMVVPKLWAARKLAENTSNPIILDIAGATMLA
jgi:hypothetical protein